MDAMVYGGGERFVGGECIVGGAEARQSGKEDEERNECSREECEEPFLLSSHGGGPVCCRSIWNRIN